MERLPEAEFEIMKIAWEQSEPITTSIILDTVGKKRNWQPTTVITLLGRLLKRGFLSREKKGREYHYSPAIAKNDYLAYETKFFLKNYHENSLVSLSASLSENLAGKNNEKDLMELKDMLKRLGGE